MLNGIPIVLFEEQAVASVFLQQTLFPLILRALHFQKVPEGLENVSFESLSGKIILTQVRIFHELVHVLVFSRRNMRDRGKWFLHTFPVVGHARLASDFLMEEKCYAYTCVYVDYLLYVLSWHK